VLTCAGTDPNALPTIMIENIETSIDVSISAFRTLSYTFTTTS
jgi:hypothetical protein